MDASWFPSCHSIRFQSRAFNLYFSAFCGCPKPKAMNFPLVYGRHALQSNARYQSKLEPRESPNSRHRPNKLTLRLRIYCIASRQNKTCMIRSMIGRSPDCKLYTYGMYVGAHQRTPSRVVLPSRRRCVILALLPELGSSCASGTQHGHAYAYSTRSSIYTKHGRSNNHPRTARGHTHTLAGVSLACLIDCSRD